MFSHENFTPHGLETHSYHDPLGPPRAKTFTISAGQGTGLVDHAERRRGYG